MHPILTILRLTWLYLIATRRPALTTPEVKNG